MLCSLLALATGMALGSRIAATAPEAPVSIRLPDASTWRSAYVTADAADLRSTPDAGTAPAIDTTERGLEGNRQPRMPRMSRDVAARPTR